MTRAAQSSKILNTSGFWGVKVGEFITRKANVLCFRHKNETMQMPPQAATVRKKTPCGLVKGCFILKRILEKISPYSQKITQYLSKRKAEPIFIFLFLPVFMASLGGVSGQNISSGHGAASRLEVSYGEHLFKFETYKPTVFEALTAYGLEIYPQDEVLPSRESPLVGQTVKVKVKQSLPVVIWDGEKKVLGRSTSNDPSVILAQNGIKTYPEDIIISDLITDPFSDQGAGQKVVIKRAPEINLLVDGKLMELRSWRSTLGEVLEEKQIKLNPTDKIEPGLGTAVRKGLYATITRILERDIETTVVIDPPIEYKDDYSVSVGQNRVSSEGKAGTKIQRFHITVQGSIELGRVLVSEQIMSAPQPKVIVRGTRPYSTGPWGDTLAAAAGQYGVSAQDMHKVMMCESHGDPNAGSYRNSKYKGLFQYDQNTWDGASFLAGFGGRSIYDGAAQIFVTAWKVRHDGGWRAWGCKP